MLASAWCCSAQRVLCDRVLVLEEHMCSALPLTDFCLCHITHPFPFLLLLFLPLSTVRVYVMDARAFHSHGGAPQMVQLPRAKHANALIEMFSSEGKVQGLEGVTLLLPKVQSHHHICMYDTTSSLSTHAPLDK